MVLPVRPSGQFQWQDLSHKGAAIGCLSGVRVTSLAALIWDDSEHAGWDYGPNASK